MPRKLREESRAWLILRGVNRHKQQAWPPEGVMPEEV
jgi:hypothetical protein